jgi:hypothetical protein
VQGAQYPSYLAKRNWLIRGEVPVTMNFCKHGV